MKQFFWWSAAQFIVLAALLGCGDGLGEPTPGTGGNGGKGATTGGGGTGAGGSSAGGNGAGGCLSSSEHDAVFSIDIDGMCLVAKYDIGLHLGLDPNTYTLVVPRWGRHGGPLTIEQAYANGLPTDEVTLKRWALPAEPTGTAYVQEQIGPLSLGASESSPYLNPAAIDLPFNDWTIVAYDVFNQPAGEAFALDGSTIEQTFDVNGMFSAVGVSSGNTNRILHASGSPLASPGTDSKGLYAAEICSGATACNPVTVHEEGDVGGPLTLDADGNLFAVFPNLANTTQTVRGFSAAEVAPMATATAGNELATLAGSGIALAALAPGSSGEGIVLFQALDDSFTLQDPVAQRFTVSGDQVLPEGVPVTAFTMAVAGTEITLMSDDQDRLWVGVANGVDSSLYVIARED